MKTFLKNTLLVVTAPVWIPLSMLAGYSVMIITNTWLWSKDSKVEKKDLETNKLKSKEKKQ